MLGRGSAGLPGGCAMICLSVGHRVGFVFVPRMVGRSIPMTGINRSNPSSRTILILLVLLGAPMATRSTTLEDSAKELARKIAAALSMQESTSVDIQNISTLTPREVDRVSQALSGALQDSGFSLNRGGAIHVSVMLSENVKGFLWSAEISRGDVVGDILAAGRRPSEEGPALNSILTLFRGG